MNIRNRNMIDCSVGAMSLLTATVATVFFFAAGDIPNSQQVNVRSVYPVRNPIKHRFADNQLPPGRHDGIPDNTLHSFWKNRKHVPDGNKIPLVNVASVLLQN